MNILLMGGHGMMSNLIKKKNKMGLLVNATAEKKILIQGTEIEVPSVYVRLEYFARLDGRELYITVHVYNNKDSYKNGISILLTDLPVSHISVTLKEDEEQNLQNTELYSKARLEELGYVVDIL